MGKAVKDELNRFGIFLLDIFMLDYYGVQVFLQVTKTTEETVFLTELATKMTKHGLMLTKRLRPSKNPLIVLKDNSPTKTTYEVKPINLRGKEYWLPIEIGYGDPIYQEAKKYHKSPVYGYAYAVPIKDVIGKYWLKSITLKEKERLNWA